MTKIRNKLFTTAISLAALSVGFLSPLSTAGAASTTAEVTGTASVTIGDFATTNSGGVVLDGTTKTINFAVTDMTLVDARGSGAGWSVNLTAAAFTNAAGLNSGLNTLQSGSLVLGTVSIVAGEGSTPVTNIAIGSGAIDTTRGVKILNAGINEGMGTYVVSIARMTLTLPRKAEAGAYTSTITMTLSQGPVG